MIKNNIMDISLRNTLISVIVTILLVFIGAWIQLNSRISVLEIQVKSDHELFQTNSDKSDKDMEDVKSMLSDIKVSITHLQDIKQDKQ